MNITLNNNLQQLLLPQLTTSNDLCSGVHAI